VNKADALEAPEKLGKLLGTREDEARRGITADNAVGRSWNGSPRKGHGRGADLSRGIARDCPDFG
jgi:hypothetical protein